MSFAPDIYNKALDIITLDNDSLLILSNAGHIDTTFDNDVVLTKLTPNGEIDTEYGNNGHTRFDFPELDHSIADEMLKLADGSIMVLGSGYSYDNTEYLPTCITHVLTNGQIDSTFGDYGTKVLPFAGFQDFPNSIEQDASGRILISGSTLDTGHLHSDVPVIARMDINGNLDQSFGEGGKVYLRFANGAIQETRDSRHFSGGVIYDLLEAGNGQLIISGAHSNGVNYIAFIARLNADGSLDSAFFDDGHIGFDIYPYENSIAVKLLKGENNSVWFGAHTQALDYNDFFFGNIDLTHMSYDVSTIDINDNEDFIMEILDGHNGLPIFIGSSRKPENNILHYHSDYFSVVQLTADNFPYSSVSYTFEFNPGFQSGAVAATYQSDNRLVCLGFSNLDSAGTNELALVALDYITDGLNENNPFQPILYPNPASDILQVKLPLQDDYTISVYNSLSQIVLQKESIGITNETLNISTLPQGFYPVTIINSNGDSHTSIIIKK